MIRKGYVEQQIEMLGAFLARLVFFKNSDDYTGAQAEIRTACKKLVGLDINMLMSLPEPSVVSLFTSGDATDPGRCFAAGALLAEQANLYERQDRNASNCHCRALTLLIEALLQEPHLRTAENLAQVDALRARIEGQTLSFSLQNRLSAYDALQSE